MLKHGRYEYDLSTAIQNDLMPVGEILGRLATRILGSDARPGDGEAVAAMCPAGYWYINYTGNQQETSCIDVPTKVMPLLRLAHDFKKSAEYLKPYIIKKWFGGTENVFDPWYIMSLYDALPLGLALNTIASRCSNNNAEAFGDLLIELFHKIKREVISGCIKIPLGREILLNTSFSLMDDMFSRHELERQDLIIIDRKDYFSFLMERSGIDRAYLPGAVILRYESDRTNGKKADDMRAAKSNASPSFDPDIMTTLSDLINYGSQLVSHNVSKTWVYNALEKEGVNPIFVPMESNKPKGYPKKRAFDAVAAKARKE